MKAPNWTMAAAFVAVSVLAVLVSQPLELGSDYRLLIAMVLGAGACGLMQKVSAGRKENV